MSPFSFSTGMATAIAFGLVTLLAACGSESTADKTSDASGASAQTEQGPEADSGSEAKAHSPGGGGLDTLHADSLHDGVETAAPGNAYITIDDERLDFTELECDVTELDGGSAMKFAVEGATSYGVTKLSVLRGIGWDVGFEYEEELIQVTHVEVSGDGNSFVDWNSSSNFSMAQNSGDEDGGIKWRRGSGPDPMIRMVGSDVTATGTLSGMRDAYGSEFAFEMAANCD